MSFFSCVLMFQVFKFLRPVLAKFQLPRHTFQQKFVLKTPVWSHKIISEDLTFENLGGTYLPIVLLTISPGGERLDPSRCCREQLICRDTSAIIWVNSHILLTLTLALTLTLNWVCVFTKWANSYLFSDTNSYQYTTSSYLYTQ